jgi:hypothetical protein
MNKIVKVVIFSILVANCQKTDPTTGEKVLIETDPYKKQGNLPIKEGEFSEISIKLINHKGPTLNLRLQIFYGGQLLSLWIFCH